MEQKIWDKVAELMAAQKVNMPQLAEKAKVSRQTLYNLKRKGIGRSETIRAVAEALGVGPGYLTG
jgi:DNA-binding phage protein